MIAPDVATAAATGPVRVVVELDLPNCTAAFTGPTDELPARRQAVQTARDGVLAALAGKSATVERSFDTLPFIALTVGADALERAPGVERVSVDRLMAPTLHDSASRPSSWRATTASGAR